MQNYRLLPELDKIVNLWKSCCTCACFGLVALLFLFMHISVKTLARKSEKVPFAMHPIQHSHLLFASISDCLCSGTVFSSRLDLWLCRLLCAGMFCPWWEFLWYDCLPKPNVHLLARRVRGMNKH